MLNTQRHQTLLLPIITGFAICSIIFSLLKGSIPFLPAQILSFSHHELGTIIWQLRLPRTLTAFCAGSLLALAGTLMQLLLQNPLADPYVLGISGGAAFCSLLALMLGASSAWLFGTSWAGSLLVMLCIALISRRHWQPHTLLLSGIAVSCAFSSLISFLLLIAPDKNLHSMLFWLSGDLNDAQMPWLAAIILSVGLPLCQALAPGLNIYGRGEQEAQALGLPCRTYRLLLYCLTSLFTATAVSIAGCIGFIGLVIPHISRKFGGYDHRIILPVSTLLGGSLLTLADTCARTLLAPVQLPVGIVTALLGIPVFIWMLQQ